MDDKINLKDELVPEIKQEPESLDMTPLTSFNSIMRQALGYDDLTPIDLTKHISVALRSSTGSNAIAEREVDSDILRFFASGEYPATSLKVSIVPVQEGTGDPSPENIRPITGWTEVKVYQAAEYDEEAEPVLEIALGDDAGTVYGGILDVVTGVLTVTMAKQTFEWGTGGTSLGNYTRKSKAIGSNAFGGQVGNRALCSVAPYNTNYAGDSLHFYIEGTQCLVYLPNDTASDFQFDVVYFLKTPSTFELDPEELSTLVGENNIWADCGPVESITY